MKTISDGRGDLVIKLFQLQRSSGLPSKHLWGLHQRGIDRRPLCNNELSQASYCCLVVIGSFRSVHRIQIEQQTPPRPRPGPRWVDWSPQLQPGTKR